MEVRVATLEGNLHSGQFGGAAPDALAALIRMLASLRDESGATTVDGLDGSGEWTGLAYPEEEFRRDAKVLDGVELVGTRQRLRPPVGAAVGDGARHRRPAGRRRHSLRARHGRCADQRAGAAGHDGRAGVAGAGGAPAGRGALGGEGGGGAARQRTAVPADTASPAYTAMADAMREAYGEETGRRRAGRFDPAVQHPGDALSAGGDPAHRSERARGADPRGQRERVAARNWSGCRWQRRCSCSATRPRRRPAPEAERRPERAPAADPRHQTTPAGPHVGRRESGNAERVGRRGLTAGRRRNPVTRGRHSAGCPASR